MEADFQAHYGLDLLDVYRGRLSVGKAMRLIAWLPDDGAFSASVQDAAPASNEQGKPPTGPRRFYGRGLVWHLLADIWDLQAAIGHAGGKGRPPKYPRPGVASRRRGTPMMNMAPVRRVAGQPPRRE